MKIFDKTAQLWAGKKKWILLGFSAIVLAAILLIVLTLPKRDAETPVIKPEGSSLSLPATEPATAEETSTQVAATTRTQVTNTSRVTGTTACTHAYRETVVSPTCTKQGYTLHTCIKCKKTYRDATVAPNHDFDKLLCIRCGRPDPDRSVLSLTDWVTKNGAYYGNGLYTHVDYEENGAVYSIITNPHYMDIVDFTYQKGEEYFRISLYDIDQCYIYYSHGGLQANADPQRASLSSSTVLKLREFTNNSGDGRTEKEVAAYMSKKMDGILKTVQNKMLSPRTGLTLKDFGLMKY